jgi:hypothetical protein
MWQRLIRDLTSTRRFVRAIRSGNRSSTAFRCGCVQPTKLRFEPICPLVGDLPITERLPASARRRSARRRQDGRRHVHGLEAEDDEKLGERLEQGHREGQLDDLRLAEMLAELGLQRRRYSGRIEEHGVGESERHDVTRRERRLLVAVADVFHLLLRQSLLARHGEADVASQAAVDHAGVADTRHLLDAILQHALVP